MTKLRLACATAALAATASGTALAEATANVGFMSDYIFRGAYQAEAVAFAGVDIETENGFYLGTWGANLEDGLEYDIYLGYSGGGENFTWYAGLTGYYYTDEFDDTYEELNLGFSYGFLTVDYALGDYHYDPSNFMDPNAGDTWSQFWDKTQTYEYVGVTFAPEVGPYYFIGRTDYHNISVSTEWLPPDQRRSAYNSGKDGYWVELGKSFEIMEDLELNVAALYSGDIRQESPPTKNSSVIFNDPSEGDVPAEFALTITVTKTLRIND